MNLSASLAFTLRLLAFIVRQTQAHKVQRKKKVSDQRYPWSSVDVIAVAYLRKDSQHDMCSNLFDPSLSVRGCCNVATACLSQRWTGPFSVLEDANLLESRHILMQDDGVEVQTDAFMPYDAFQKRSATFMGKIRVQCLFAPTSFAIRMTKYFWYRILLANSWLISAYTFYSNRLQASASKKQHTIASYLSRT